MNDKIQSLSLSILFYVIICGSAELEHRLEKLESLVQEQLKDKKSLDRRLVALKTSIADLHARTVSGVQTERHKEYIRTTFSRLPFEIDSDRKRTAGEGIAFYAYSSTSKSYNTHEIFQFDISSLNVKEGYTPDDGIFNVPVGGVYIFTWTVAVPPSARKIVTELVVHGHVKGVLVSDSDESQFGGSGVHPATAVIIARANTGDNVYIRARQAVGGLVNILSDDNIVRTTFSGWLLS